jgi:hypothetical protein
MLDMAIHFLELLLNRTNPLIVAEILCAVDHLLGLTTFFETDKAGIERGIQPEAHEAKT